MYYWTSTAVKQRNYIFAYWNIRNHSNSYSKKLRLSINLRIELLKTHPELGKKTEFRKIRAISLGHYSILYKQIKDRIIIVGFWDNRRNPKTLLQFLSGN